MSTTAIRLSVAIIDEAKITSRLEHRSVPGQIEHWARLGKCAEENPDLTMSVLKEVLQGLSELESGQRIPYKFGARARS